jgi:hypothetical protein
MRFLARVAGIFLVTVLIATCGGGSSSQRSLPNAEEPLVWDEGNWDEVEWQ